MTKKARNRLLGVLMVILAILSIGLVVNPLIKEQKEKEKIAQEEEKHTQFFAWRDQ